jgi:serine/threonine protein kinase
LAYRGAARQRFAREAKAAAAVVHEHVVAIHNVEAERDLPFLVMQYVAGESLQARVDREGPLEAKEILRIGIQCASGLAAAHEQGVVHRDVKPGNILLENGVERALLTDFGFILASSLAPLSTGLPSKPTERRPIIAPTCSAWARSCTLWRRATRRFAPNEQWECCIAFVEIANVALRM